MYKEHGTAAEAAQAAVKSETERDLRVFLKITRSPRSLETLLSEVNGGGFQLLELSLRPSLDMHFQFVHLLLEGSGDAAAFGNSLCRLPMVKCAEVGAQPRLGG